MATSDYLPIQPKGESLTEVPTLQQPAYQPLPPSVLETEACFYREYPWCLNVFPTVHRISEYLTGELRRLDLVQEDWQYAEAMANVFLLSCAFTDTLDDYLMGRQYDFSKVKSAAPFLKPAVLVADQFLKTVQKARALWVGELTQWREHWDAAVHNFLVLYVAGGRPEAKRLDECRNRLLTLLSREIPTGLRSRRVRKPAAFRSQDLTGFDILYLGKKFVSSLADSQRPILVVGLRTAGSYFAPLLRAYLAHAGCQETSCVTLRPKKGASARELARIQDAAKKKALAVVIDEPANTGSTLAACVDILRKAGFASRDVMAMFPVHPTRRDWNQGEIFQALIALRVLTLQPEEYYKCRLLESGVVEALVGDYFRNRGWKDVRCAQTETSESLNRHLESLSEQKFHHRLKRVYEVRLYDSFGKSETRYVLAKSVGWAWLSYHAFLAGERLSEYVPPLLGLRDGILYTEWVPDAPPTGRELNREDLIRSVASYVATRVNTLRLNEDPSPDLCRANWHKGLEHLAEILSRAYGWNATASLMRHRVRNELARQACPVPTLIDGKMRGLEWVHGNFGLLKTDFEHHGLGKIELSVTDPAYDLAEAILHFHLSEAEENQLLEAYAQISGDSNVRERLFLYKVLAGTWTMRTAVVNLQDPRLVRRHPEFNKQYLDAWNFSTIHTTRFCAALCHPPRNRHWSSPVVMMDIDGVLDKLIFGFPSTTAAGIRAVSLLHAHGFPIAVNTARSPAEVKEYCRAYGFIGGVGEYGSYVWDALTDRECVLVSQESLDELARLRAELQRIPGVFLNDAYQYSIKAHTFEGGRTAPLPTALIQQVMASLNVSRLTLHQTYTDSTIVAREVDKGSGMRALLELAGIPNPETLAIGDSEPDLPMFRLATRCFAPAQIPCRQAARLLGCRIAKSRYQPGLLEIVRSITHPDGGQCSQCQASQKARPKDGGVFVRILEAADQKRPVLLLRAMLDPMSLEAFAR